MIRFPPVFAILFGFSAGLVAQPETPAPDAVIRVMERAADWQLAHPDPEHPSTSWHAGTLYAGVMALAQISDHTRFERAVMKIGGDLDWKLGPRLYNPDDQAVGQTWTELYFRHRDPRMIQPMRKAFDQILAHPVVGNLQYDRTINPNFKNQWAWCDALFMAPPAWIRLWQATHDQRYLHYAVEHWWQTSGYLYDTGEHLFFRDNSYFDRREKNGAKIFWSRGNGWVLGGLARIIPWLPEHLPTRPLFIKQFQEICASVLKCQQPDGLWRASLLDAGAYPMKETSGSSFYCFAFAWGVNQGLLDRDTYAPAALKAWQALTDCIAEDGRLTHVQPVGATPETFDKNHAESFGTGAFLLAGSEIHRLVQP